jgi:hypothetical protein
VLPGHLDDLVDGGPRAKKKKVLAVTSDATIARKSPRRFLEKVGNSLSSAALLYVFGVVLWALQTERMERLQTEVASRPMRSFAVGSVISSGSSAASWASASPSPPASGA